MLHKLHIVCIINMSVAKLRIRNMHSYNVARTKSQIIGNFYPPNNAREIAAAHWPFSTNFITMSANGTPINNLQKRLIFKKWLTNFLPLFLPLLAS